MPATDALARGFSQGFGLMNSVYDRKDAKEERGLARQERAEDRQFQMEERDYQRSERQRKIDEQQAQRDIGSRLSFLRDKQASGEELTEQEAQWVKDGIDPHFKAMEINPPQFFSEEGQAGAEVAGQVLNTKSMDVLRDPLARHVLGDWVFGESMRSKRQGKTTRTGAARTGQEVVDFRMTPNGTLALNSLVSGDDGENYTAWLTQGGDADPKKDPNLYEVPVDKAMDKAAGMYALHRGIEESGVMPMLRALYVQQGGKLSDFAPAKSNRRVVPGADDQYLVDLDAGTTTGLGVGVKQGRGISDQSYRTKDINGRVMQFNPETRKYDQDLGPVTQKGGKGGTPTSLERNANLYIESGLVKTKAEALKRLEKAKYNPVAESVKIAKEWFKAQNERRVRPGDEDYKTLEEFGAEAKAFVQMMLEGEPEPEAAADAGISADQRRNIPESIRRPTQDYSHLF